MIHCESALASEALLCRAMADLVIGRLQSTAAAVLGQPNDPKAVEVSNQPFLLSGNWGHRHTACYLEQEFKSLVKDVKVQCIRLNDMPQLL